tara:strand:+ start:41 stop:409 length:369 start_codon:yes stop_codon:yes gene_type:complete
MTKTKRQLLWQVKDLLTRDKAWIKDYNKLQKKLDKAELEVYDLKNNVAELEYKSDKYKEERDINANDVEHVKQTKDHMELQYLKDIVRLQDKVINHTEHKPVVYVNGAQTPNVTTSSSTTVV